MLLILLNVLLYNLQYNVFFFTVHAEPVSAKKKKKKIYNTFLNTSPKKTFALNIRLLDCRLIMRIYLDCISVYYENNCHKSQNVWSVKQKLFNDTHNFEDGSMVGGFHLVPFVQSWSYRSVRVHLEQL